MRLKTVMFLIGLALALPCPVFAAKAYQDIDAADVKAMMDHNDALVVFPLSPIEFEDKHITGSVNMPLESLKNSLPEDKTKAIVFYCLGTKCVASWRAAEKAVQLGYQKVYAFREGLPAWEKAGYPLTSIRKLPDIEVKKISTEELAYLSAAKNVVVLDINMDRDASTFQIDCTNRIHIPLDELNVSLQKLPKDKRIFVICLKGERSPTAVRYLSGQGYKDVAMVEGGVQKWILEGRPVKQTE